ncbi:MAG: ATP-binding protein [Candidatus Omnitrophota bacterium]
MKKIKIGFRTKLLFSYVFVILFSFSLIAFFLDKNLEENSLQDLKNSLINQAQLIESQLSTKNLTQTDIASLETLVNSLSSKIKSRITIVDTKGQVLADSEKSREEVLKMENHADRPEIKSALSGLVGGEIRYSATLKINMLYVAVPIRVKDEITGVVRLALPLVNVQKMLFNIRKSILFSVLFALGLAFVLGSMLTSGIIKTINKIIHASRKFSSGDFSHKIYHDSTDEIGELADTLNKMAQDIEDKIKDVNSQSQQLKAIFNSMIEGVMLVDSAGSLISINPAIERIFGITKKDVEGKVFLESIRNNDISEIINSVLKKGKSISSELSLVYPMRRIFEVNATPIFENNAVTGCLVVIHDITQIRNLETMRSDFVANVSHELKTPLTSIKGFVETLLEGASEDKENSRHFLKIIQDHAERLHSLINDLLTLSHIESKEIKLSKQQINSKELTDEVLAGFRSQLKKKLIKIQNDLPKDLSVKADKEKIEQVVTNLIDNAIKFNKDNGFIKIYNQDSDSGIKIIVEDSGIGIPIKDLSRIFERFYRVDKARSRELGGTGLGLSIVKHIVELHGGSVGVESTEGFGSKFWFILPK